MIDSLCNMAIQQQETLHNYTIILVFLVVFSVFLIVGAVGMSYYYENTVGGMKRVVNRYQKYLQEKGVAVES